MIKTVIATSNAAAQISDRQPCSIDCSPTRKKGRKLGKRKKLFNRYHAKARAVGERGAATLKQWHILRKARYSPGRMTAVVQAILTLEYQGR
ncbi:transposase family protein [Actinomadura chokoriensis]|uniref:transposase family protein n=1 Tax=Actinomadura chokoriensis TaxID=454156 RepID=UPI0031F8C840